MKQILFPLLGLLLITGICKAQMPPLLSKTKEIRPPEYKGKAAKDISFETGAGSIIMCHCVIDTTKVHMMIGMEGYSKLYLLTGYEVNIWRRIESPSWDDNGIKRESPWWKREYVFYLHPDKKTQFRKNYIVWQTRPYNENWKPETNQQ